MVEVVFVVWRDVVVEGRETSRRGGVRRKTRRPPRLETPAQNFRQSPTSILHPRPHEPPRFQIKGYAKVFHTDS